MSHGTNVVLIHKDRVASFLKKLEAAEAVGKAIAVIKKQLREYANNTRLGHSTIRHLSQRGLSFCQKHMRDVGENTFVFDDGQILEQLNNVERSSKGGENETTT